MMKSHIIRCEPDMIQLGISRIANTLPTYDFISGNNASTSPVQTIRNTLRQSHAPKAGVSSISAYVRLLIE